MTRKKQRPRPDVIRQKFRALQGISQVDPHEESSAFVKVKEMPDDSSTNRTT